MELTLESWAGRDISVNDGHYDKQHHNLHSKDRLVNVISRMILILSYFNFLFLEDTHQSWIVTLLTPDYIWFSAVIHRYLSDNQYKRTFKIHIGQLDTMKYLLVRAPESLHVFCTDSSLLNVFVALGSFLSTCSQDLI